MVGDSSVGMKKCPTCGKPVDWRQNPFRPFCSERCKLVDLGRWVNDEYRIPGKSSPPNSTEIPGSPPEHPQERE